MLATACAIVACALAQTSLASAAPLSIRIEGNHFVNGAGQTIRLLGVNHPSFEYACVDGFGYDDGHMDNADAAAVASWNADAVRVPLNEDCWLGINGQPNNSQEALTKAGYQQAVESYVAALNAHGIYAILDLHWTAPGSLVANGQRPMPDAHSTEFWTSVASTFKDNPAVVFDLFNEPYSPALVNDPGHPVSWACWENGGCQVPTVNDSEAPNGNLYQAVGMQALVNTVRATGATQPLMLAASPTPTTSPSGSHSLPTTPWARRRPRSTTTKARAATARRAGTRRSPRSPPRCRSSPASSTRKSAGPAISTTNT